MINQEILEASSLRSVALRLSKLLTTLSNCGTDWEYGIHAKWRKPRHYRFLSSTLNVTSRITSLCDQGQAVRQTVADCQQLIVLTLTVLVQSIKPTILNQKLLSSESALHKPSFNPFSCGNPSKKLIFSTVEQCVRSFNFLAVVTLKEKTNHDDQK